MSKTIKIDNNEYWFVGAVDDGCCMPFSVESKYEINLTKSNKYNQASSVLLSTTGKAVFANEADIKIKNGEITVYSDNLIEEQKVGTTLKDAYSYIAKNYFTLNGKTPPSEFFLYPQFNDWMKVGYNQTQEKVLNYAKEIVKSGYPYKILIIDDKWSDYYGSFEFNAKRFPDPKAMLDELHMSGFKVILWETPYISPDSEEFRELSALGGLVKNADGSVAIREWWNGYSAVLDLSNTKTASWLRKKNALLLNMGVDGFKFDGGDTDVYAFGDKNYGSLTPCGMNKEYSLFASGYEYSEMRSSFNCGGLPLVQRQSDKKHSWGEDGIKKLIPSLIVQSLCGYAYSCPDMIGGGNILDINGDIDEELFIRYAECSALMPMMQFSKLPCEILSEKANTIVKKYAKLHTEIAEYIYSLAKKFALTGEPICRCLEYDFPRQNFENEMQTFMLGEKYLVAPVLKKGQRKKTVRLPKGCMWKYVPNGEIYNGGETVTVNADIEILPYFERII